MRRLKWIGLLSSAVVVAGALWYGWLRRFVPRAEQFPPEPGSVAELAFAFVFTDAASAPGQDDTALLQRAEALLAQPIIRIADKPHRALGGDARDYVSLSI